ncbi:MAG: pantoate--beta-alanine ligase [Syntrophomonadales bacterium]
MKVIESPQEMQNWSRAQAKTGLSIGLVPTMGYLHEGHLSLVRQARELCDQVVVSIFVNPIQFGEGEDFDRYPRDLSRDLDLLEKEGVGAVFAPTARAMYPEKEQTNVEPPTGMENRLCGRNRPGHFRGVTTVVSKLFNICLPDVAVFGQKDAQQALIIEKMVRDLNFPVRIVRGEIVREPDGLAMSSRNVYLSPEDRKNATVLYRSLLMAKDLIKRGERNPSQVRNAMYEMINRVDGTQIDYIEIYNAKDLSELEEINGQVLLALAVRFGDTRLIDNLLLEV